MSPGNVAREGIPFELFRSTYPGRHVARERAEAMGVSLMVAKTARSIDPKHSVSKWGRRISKFFLQLHLGNKLKDG
ncbi:hypothetical protein Tco_1165962 [Tanacetum coccineum]